MFIDKVLIRIKAGDGGDGFTSFHTEKYVPNGGPDGGDGGNGGSIVFVADRNKASLLDFRHLMKFHADSGQRGGTKNCHGSKGSDLIVKVPTGTVIKDAESGRIIADMFETGHSVVVLKGGMGGKGNARFKTSRRQSPHFSQAGEKTLEQTVTLEYKTIADVGLVGYPNVGKSTLLSVMSAARPKIANYHFTTLSPNLGVVSRFDSTFVVADIPGLIEGAADGVGLGHEFLRHIERTRLIVHVVDVSGCEGRDAYADYKNINKELRLYNKHLSRLPQIIALSKTDVLGGAASEEGKKAIREFKKHIRGKKVLAISGATGEGIDALIDEVARALAELPPPAPIEFEPFEYTPPSKDDFAVSRCDDGSFLITGGLMDELSRNVVMDDYDSFNYFQKQLRDRGVIKALRKAGAADGDNVRILDIEFEYVE